MTKYLQDALDYLKDKAESDDIGILKYCVKHNIDKKKSLERLHDIMTSGKNGEEMYSEKDKDDAAKAIYEVMVKTDKDNDRLEKQLIAKTNE